MYDKKTLVVIIVLLVIFAPLAVIGTYRHINNQDDNVVIDDNPNHEFIYNNKVYFYYNNELINTYPCNNCSNVVTTINDTEYHTNYYKYGTEEIEPIISSVQAIFTEGDKIIIYDYNLNVKLAEYDAIKTYNIANTNNLMFAQIGDVWRVIQLSENGIVAVLDSNFNYVALPNHLTSDHILDGSKIIVNNDDVWQIVDVLENNALITVNEEIVDFNDDYYITYTDGYHIYNYNGEEIFSNIIKSYVATIDNYTLIVSNINNLLVYRDSSNTITQNITLPNYEEIDFVKSDNGIDIMLDGNLHNTIALD